LLFQEYEEDAIEIDISGKLAGIRKEKSLYAEKLKKKEDGAQSSLQGPLLLHFCLKPFLL